MAHLDTSKLEELVAQDKWEEVRKQLEEYFRADLSPEDKGQIYAIIAMSHMAAQNSLNRQRIEILDGLMQEIKQLQGEQKKLEDQVDLTLARNQLKKD